jgi:fructokinase
MRIGVDLGGTKIEAVVLSHDGQELVRQRVSTPQDDYDQTISAISALVSQVSNEANCGAQTPVGIGIPGAISGATGLVKNANSTCLIGHSLDTDVQAALKRPVRVANDANCFSISEAIDGAGKGHGIVFGVILGTGVGGGIAIDGKTHAGLNSIAGEWGHNPLPWAQHIGGLSESPGPTCYCGEKGCIETFVSGPGLSNDFFADGGTQATAEAISLMAEDGSVPAKAAIARYIHRLARSLASVVNILDPDVIVFGGGLSNISEIYETLPKLLNDYVFSDVCDTPCVKNVHGDSSGVRGAAWLWGPDEAITAL